MKTVQKDIGCLNLENTTGRRKKLNCLEISEGKQLAMDHDCKFIETSSGIQHNVDELLVGVLKQIRLREDLDKKRRKKKLLGGSSRTSLSLSVARDILQKMCLQDNRSKSCENLLVL